MRSWWRGTVYTCQDQEPVTTSETSETAIFRCSRSFVWWRRTMRSRSRTAHRAAGTTANPAVEWVLTNPVRVHTTTTIEARYPISDDPRFRLPTSDFRSQGSQLRHQPDSVSSTAQIKHRESCARLGSSLPFVSQRPDGLSPFCRVIASRLHDAVCTAGRHTLPPIKKAKVPMTRSSVSQALVIIKQGIPVPPSSDSSAEPGEGASTTA